MKNKAGCYPKSVCFTLDLCLAAQIPRKGMGINMAWVFVLCPFAAIGLVAVFMELFRLFGRRRLRFTCLLFGDEAKSEWDARTYSVVFLCRSELQEEELIRRLSEGEKRKIYVRRW